MNGNRRSARRWHRSAVANDQISSSLSEVKHGLFSSFLMRGLEEGADANGDRKFTASELHGYIVGNVPKEAAHLDRSLNP